MRENPAHDVTDLHRSRLPRHLLAAAENDERGNAADRESGSGLRCRFGIDLGETYMRELFCSIRKMRCRHRARAAPTLPEVDHDRQPGVRDAIIAVAACGVARFACACDDEL